MRIPDSSIVEEALTRKLPVPKTVRRFPGPLACHDIDAQALPQSFQIGHQLVSRYYGADARRGTGEDQIPRLQANKPRDFCYQLGHRPYHVPPVALLHQIAVTGERQLPHLLQVSITAQLQGGAGGRSVEAFCQLPGAALGFGLLLHIAAGHVQANAKTADQTESLFNGHLKAVAPEGNHQLQFMVHILRKPGIHKTNTWFCQCALRFEKKEWRFALGIMTHLTGMLGVVATNADNFIHRKALLRMTNDGQRTGMGGHDGFRAVLCYEKKTLVRDKSQGQKRGYRGVKVPVSMR